MTTKMFIVTESLDAYVNSLANCDGQLSGILQGIATGFVESAVEAGFHLPHAEALKTDVTDAGVKWAQLSVLLPQVVGRLGDHSLATKMAESAFTGAVGAVVMTPESVLKDDLAGLTVQTVQPVPGAREVGYTKEALSVSGGEGIVGTGDGDFVTTEFRRPDGSTYYEVTFDEALGGGAGGHAGAADGSLTGGLEESRTWYVASQGDVGHLKELLIAGVALEVGGGAVLGGAGVILGMSLGKAAVPPPATQSEGAYVKLQGSVGEGDASASGSASLHVDGVQSNGQDSMAETVDYSGQAEFNLTSIGIDAGAGAQLDVSATVTQGPHPTLTVQGTVQTTDALTIGQQNIVEAGQAHQVTFSATIDLDSNTANDLLAVLKDPASASADIQNLMKGAQAQFQVFQGTSSSADVSVPGADISGSTSSFQLVHSQTLTL